jgi:hypothetical protein
MIYDLFSMKDKYTQQAFCGVNYQCSFLVKLKPGFNNNSYYILMYAYGRLKNNKRIFEAEYKFYETAAVEYWKTK